MDSLDFNDFTAAESLLSLRQAVGDVFSLFCRALARRNPFLSGVQVDAEDIEQTSYLRIAAHLRKLPTLAEQRNYLFRVAEHYVGEMRRRSVTRSLALAKLRSECTRTAAYGARRTEIPEVLERVIPRLAPILPSMGFFKSACYVLRAWAELEYGSIATVFEQAVSRTRRPDGVRAYVLEMTANELSRLPPCVLGMLRSINPEDDEIARVADGIATHGSDYWHDGKRETSASGTQSLSRRFKRLRGWRYRVNLEIQAHLKTIGFDSFT